MPNNGHIDLFTGIGGFTLAAQWAGLKTEVFCEKDKRCREFLSRTYPGIPIITEIRNFDGTQWTGAFILTAGVPCQPASRAGKQGGKTDDRWLWPEAIRIIDEAKPRWCLLENPPGIYDVGFDGILADLEGIGYEVGTVEIPAAAVNSPQIRQRVWIVAHCSEPNDGRSDPGTGERQIQQPGIGDGSIYMAHPSEGQFQNEGRRPERGNGVASSSQGDMADTGSINSEVRGAIGHDEAQRTGPWAINTGLSPWDSYHWTPCADGKLRRTPHNDFMLASRLYPGLHQQVGEEKEIGLHRSILAALGNTVVPQIPYEIIKAIKAVTPES